MNFQHRCITQAYCTHYSSQLGVGVRRVEIQQLNEQKNKKWNTMRKIHLNGNRRIMALQFKKKSRTVRESNGFAL